MKFPKFGSWELVILIQVTTIVVQVVGLCFMLISWHYSAVAKNTFEQTNKYYLIEKEDKK